jgi:tryptophan synthase alpha chain
MSRLKKLFQEKQHHILNIYCTAGYPNLDSTLPVMEALQQSGVDIIELGMPYSDPIADGPVIQLSSMKAIENGMTLQVLFQQLKNCRQTITVPIVLMGYLNPILQFGFENFCKAAAGCGIDGLIIPDIPMYEFETEYGAICKKYNLDFVFLVTPDTTTERIQKIDSLSSGFLYAVSSSSTTGSGKNFDEVNAYLDRLQQLELTNPILVGFGIYNNETFNQVCAKARGGIIGSAFIKALDGNGDLNEKIQSFISSILK